MSSALSRFLPALAVLSTLPLIALTGCGAATSFSHPQANLHVGGKVFGGQQPVSGTVVTIYSAGTSGYGSGGVLNYLAQTVTAPDGTFTIPGGSYNCTAGEQVFILAQGGEAAPNLPNRHISLATGLGDCASAQTATVEINEVTTAVTAFALAQFFNTDLSAGADFFGTDPADLPAFTLSNQSTIPLLVDIPSGTVNPNTSLVTIEAAKIYSIANTLAACVNDATPTFTACQTLFADTTPPGGTAPSDTLQAAVQMNLYPYQNVSDLYKLASEKSPFSGLASAPNDWTVGVSYTSSNFALSIAGTATSATSASIDIDPSGRIWFTSTKPGNAGLAYFDPSSTTMNGPYLSSYLSQPQYVAIDSNGLVWTTDLGGEIVANVDEKNPATVFLYSLNGTYTPGAIAADNVGYTYLTLTDSTNTPYFGFETDSFVAKTIEAFSYPPTGLVVATYGNLYAATSGSGTPCAIENPGASPTILASTTDICTSGGAALASGARDVVSTATSLNQLCLGFEGGCGPAPAADATVLNLPEGIATDGEGAEWVANSGNGSVYTFGGVLTGYTPTSPIPYQHDINNGSTITTPYAIAIDGSGNVWVANAGCVNNSATACIPGSFRLSELIGAAAPTITPLEAQVTGAGSSLAGVRPGGSAIITEPANSSRPSVRSTAPINIIRSMDLLKPVAVRSAILP
jgi:streptogramin lyase